MRCRALRRTFWNHLGLSHFVERVAHSEFLGVSRAASTQRSIDEIFLHSRLTIVEPLRSPSMPGSLAIGHFREVDFRRLIVPKGTSGWK